ncbi:hypothetical protein [Stenotrophomonas maltophilia]|uniref:hypothetical protein n=1 Tax=Stenotrophomonas maltophilia TaxID=40324 RepID=UPI0010719F92|nr:hypothetical protein [Stenotrophomonas maltophilia]
MSAQTSWNQFLHILVVDRNAGIKISQANSGKPGRKTFIASHPGTPQAVYRTCDRDSATPNIYFVTMTRELIQLAAVIEIACMTRIERYTTIVIKERRVQVPNATT